MTPNNHRFYALAIQHGIPLPVAQQVWCGARVDVWGLRQKLGELDYGARQPKTAANNYMGGPGAGPSEGSPQSRPNN